MTVVFIGFMLTSIGSCKKAVDNIIPGANCNDLSETWVAALNAYSLDPSEANCEAYVDAFSDYVNGCATLTSAQKKELNDEIDAIDCSQ